MNYILEISLEGLLSSKRASWGLISTFIPEKDLISQRRQTNICSNGGESQIPHPSLSSSLHQSNSASRTCWKRVSQPQSCGITWAQGKSGLSQHKTPKIFFVSVQPCFRKAEEEEETSCLQGVSLWQRDWVGNRRQQTLELPRWSVTSIVNLRLSVLQKGSWSFLIFPELLIHKLFVWEQTAASLFFTTCLERVLLQGDEGQYYFPLLKTTSHCLGVNPQHWCSWFSSVISSEVTEPQKIQLCAECSPRQTPAQCIDLWRTNMSPCSSASIFGVQAQMWPFIP